MLVGAGEYDVTIPEEYVDRARRILTQHLESLTQFSDTKPALKDKDLQETKSPVSKEKQTESSLSSRTEIHHPVEKSRC